MAHKTDEELIGKSHNTARYFTENRQVAWVLLVATLVAGTFGYLQMPKRKDPLIPVRVAVAITPWPGAPAEKVEQLVTRKIEEKIASNSEVEKIESTSRNGVSVVQVTVRADAKNLGRALDDIDSRIKNIRDLPEGAQPIDFKKDFGDTAALMLTVASPRISGSEIAIRAQAIEVSVRAARSAARAGARRTVVFNFPGALNPLPIARIVDELAGFARAEGAEDVRPVRGNGFVGFDALVGLDREGLVAMVRRFESERLQRGWLHPDLWEPAIVEQPEQASEELHRVAGSRYSLRQLDDFSDQIAKRIQVSPEVAKVTRSGVLDERIYLDYSQERFASTGVTQQMLQQAMFAQNVQAPGGVARAQGRGVIVDVSGELKSEKEISDLLVSTSRSGAPYYLRDLADVSRGYEDPPRYLTFHTWRDAGGIWQRTRAITVAVQMHPGRQIADFSADVDAKLGSVWATLPEDLILVRTSDQPRQVKEKVDLFLVSYYEAIAI